jgi:hypothetical protein
MLLLLVPALVVVVVVFFIDGIAGELQPRTVPVQK